MIVRRVSDVGNNCLHPYRLERTSLMVMKICVLSGNNFEPVGSDPLFLE